MVRYSVAYNERPYIRSPHVGGQLRRLSQEHESASEPWWDLAKSTSKSYSPWRKRSITSGKLGMEGNRVRRHTISLGRQKIRHRSTRLELSAASSLEYNPIADSARFELRCFKSSKRSGASIPQVNQHVLSHHDTASDMPMLRQGSWLKFCRLSYAIERYKPPSKIRWLSYDEEHPEQDRRRPLNRFDDHTRFAIK